MTGARFARARQRSSGRGSRGAALVEAALVTPVLLVMMFGIFEFGFAFRDSLAAAFVTISIDLPIDFDAAYGTTDDWWKSEYTASGGSVTERTT